MLAQREKGAGMGEGQWVRTPSVVHVMGLCFLLTHYFENELKERTNELTPLAAYLNLV